MTQALTRPRALALLALLGGEGTPPAEGASASEAFDAGRSQPWLRGRIGLQVQELTPELREFFSAPPDRGVLVARVVPGRPAERAELQVGDVLVEAGNGALRHPHDLLHAVGAVAEGGSLELRGLRDGRGLAIRVEPEGPQGPPSLGPDPWRGFERWFERSLRRGSQELRRRVEELEQRLQDLEHRLPAGEARKTTH